MKHYLLGLLLLSGTVCASPIIEKYSFQGEWETEEGSGTVSESCKVYPGHIIRVKEDETGISKKRFQHGYSKIYLTSLVKRASSEPLYRSSYGICDDSYDEYTAYRNGHEIILRKIGHGACEETVLFVRKGPATRKLKKIADKHCPK